MLFDDNPVQKGLFTFYIEQGLHEQELLTIQQQIKKQTNIESPKGSKQTTKKKEKIKQSLERHIDANISKRQLSVKLKLSSSKQLLKENVIDIGKTSKFDNSSTVQRPPPNHIRAHEKSFIIKSTFTFKPTEPSIYSSQQSVHYTPEQTREQFNLNSFKRHLMEKKTNPSWLKSPSRTQRGSVVELPEIRKNQEIKKESRPSKSIKSKLIQEALHSGDRVRINQIRQYLRKDSPVKSNREVFTIEEETVTRSMKVFEYRQEKLLEILQRFKKG